MDSRLSNLSVKPGQKNPIDSNTIRSSSLRDYTAPRLAHRTLSAGGSALSRALAALSRGSAREAGDLLPGGRGCRRAAEPGRKYGRGTAAQGKSGRLFPVLGRA